MQEKPTKIYLATPYGHPYKAVYRARFKNVSILAFKLMCSGYHVFSPISHSHPIAEFTEGAHLDHAFWLYQDLAFLEWCDEVWVYCQKGWDSSKGVKFEIEWALNKGKPVKLINYETEEVTDYGRETYAGGDSCSQPGFNTCRSGAERQN